MLLSGQELKQALIIKTLHINNFLTYFVTFFKDLKAFHKMGVTIRSTITLTNDFFYTSLNRNSTKHIYIEKFETGMLRVPETFILLWTPSEP